MVDSAQSVDVVDEISEQPALVGDPTIERRAEADASGLRVSPFWGLVAAGSVALVGWLAPSGLLLLAFLGVVIATHEAGHLFVARRAGMLPTEFFWGFGPEVISFGRNGCRYGIRVLFLGGYVKLLGMTPSSPVPAGFPESGTYRAASVSGRLATILAGPAANIAIAVLAFAAATLAAGGSVGEALVAGFSDVWFVIASTGEALWRWVANIGDYVAAVSDGSGATEAPVRFMSPVAQAEVSGWAVSGGLVTALRWFGVLSCAVGVINLLPLPPLDGSHAAVAATEGVINRLAPGHRVSIDVSRLVPVAYLTVGVLVFLSFTALLLDLRDLS
ncbi:MAG: site-2 protease family protein [Acidimicrobiales bacterium]